MTTRNTVSLLVALSLLMPFLHIVPSQPLTLYDLAEWTTLLPAERASSPALLVAFSLRMQLVLLIVWIATTYRPTLFLQRLTLFIILGALVIAQLPPLEILQTPQDPNYQQQLLLSVLSFFAVILNFSKSRLLIDYGKYTVVVLATIGNVTTLYATTKSIAYFADYNLSAYISIAPVTLLITYGLCLLYLYQKQKRDALASRSVSQPIGV